MKKLLIALLLGFVLGAIVDHQLSKQGLTLVWVARH